MLPYFGDFDRYLPTFSHLAPRITHRALDQGERGVGSGSPFHLPPREGPTTVSRPGILDGLLHSHALQAQHTPPAARPTPVHSPQRQISIRRRSQTPGASSRNQRTAPWPIRSLAFLSPRLSRTLVRAAGTTSPFAPLAAGRPSVLISLSNRDLPTSPHTTAALASRPGVRLGRRNNKHQQPICAGRPHHISRHYLQNSSSTALPRIRRVASPRLLGWTHQRSHARPSAHLLSPPAAPVPIRAA